MFKLIKNKINKLIINKLEKVLFHKEFISNTKFDVEVKTYIVLKRHFSFKDGFWYSVTVPNKTFINNKKEKALLRALESESIGMQKYNLVKENNFDIVLKQEFQKVWRFEKM